MGAGDQTLSPGPNADFPEPRGSVSCLPWLTSWLPVQVILVIKYWTLLCVASIVLSLSSYVLMTSLTQGLWLYKISPKTFPFLCEPPLCGGGHGDMASPRGRELAAGWCPWLRGGEGRGWPSRLSVLSSVADYNVLSQPASLLVIMLNVTLNTLPVLAFRVIRKTVFKLQLKVRQSGDPQRPPPSCTDSQCPPRRPKPLSMVCILGYSLTQWGSSQASE